jgi:hypothetical protein
MPNWFEHWLHPLLAEVPVREAMHHNLTMEFGLMGASIALAVTGLFLGYYLYAAGPHPLVGKVTGAVPWLYKWVAGKLWVDELYGLVVYRPLGWFAALCHRVGDRFLIDKLMVEGSGWLANSGGWIASKLHGGRVQRYAGAMALGLAVILYFVATPRTEVEVEDQGNNTVRFVAPYEAAPYSYSWDFDGDSLEAKGDERWTRYEQVWTTSSSVQHRYPGPGTYQVVMRVRTPWKFERKRVIEVQVGGTGEED